MPLDLHSKDALLNAIQAADRPIAFLVGAPLSADVSGGVSGVADMITVARHAVEKRLPSSLPSFDATIAGKHGADVYQAAMRWVQGNLNQDAVNSIVRSAVLNARNSGASPLLHGDGEPADWHLPKGTLDLAELICRWPDKFAGPLLTTNFDPLLTLAIRLIGGLPARRVLDFDGGIGRLAEEEAGARRVIHLHGYWRDSDTLHTPTQLKAPRPRLKAALQQLLRQKVLVVLAYGGWDDVFTGALAEVMNEEDNQLDVLWCFFQTDPVRVEADNALLLQRMVSAIARGRFRTYGGINCHAIFAEMTPATHLDDPAIRSAPVSPLPAWEWIDAGALNAVMPLSDSEILRYFDGAVPTWRHAVSDRIPRRGMARDAYRRLDTLASNNPSLQLIRAAGGEGKSTLLLQVAADAARSGNWEVLWRPAPNVSLSPEQVASLDPNKQWLIVADDADNLVNVLHDTTRRLHMDGRANVDILIAARDTDWRASGGERVPWANWVTYQPDVILRGIDEGDASEVVAAWAELGKDGLGALAGESDPAARAKALARAAREAIGQRDDGSFFGGLLDVRYGKAGLQAHVREFLDRLRGTSLEGGKHTPFEAIVYVAACHGTGIAGIDQNVLADLLGIARDWIQTRVVRILGEEAVGVVSAGHVFTRHSRVAAAILVEAEQSFGVDLGEIWTRLVRQTVLTADQIHVSRQTHAPILHAGPRLQRALPLQLDEKRREEIAIAAAKAAVDYKTDWLGCVVDLGKTYRRAKRAPEAVSVFRDHLTDAASKVDFAEVIRGYWYEWSTCEGESGLSQIHAHANAWLGGLSISDHLNPAAIGLDRCKLTCAGLGVAFGRLARSIPDCPFARARRAVSWLGGLTNPDPKAAGYFARHDRAADDMRTPYTKSLEEAVAWLAAGVVAAGRELTDPFLLALALPAQVSFQHFESVLRAQLRS